MFPNLYIHPLLHTLIIHVRMGQNFLAKWVIFTLVLKTCLNCDLSDWGSYFSNNDIFLVKLYLFSTNFEQKKASGVFSRGLYF